jgi:hypothetical protein
MTRVKMSQKTQSLILLLMKFSSSFVGAVITPAVTTTPQPEADLRDLGIRSC